MRTFNLPDSIEIPVTGVDGATCSFKVAECSDETIIALIAHGAKQIANDANAGAKKAGASDEMMINTVDQKLADLEAGDHRFGGGGGGARVSELEKELRKIVESKLPKSVATKDRAKKAREVLADADRTSEKFQTLVKMAEAAIAARQGGEIDIDELL